jgi:hypothetical protein
MRQDSYLFSPPWIPNFHLRRDCSELACRAGESACCKVSERGFLAGRSLFVAESCHQEEVQLKMPCGQEHSLLCLQDGG